MPYDGKIADFADIEVPQAKPFDFDTATPDERLIELARLLEDEQAWRDKTMAWRFDHTLDMKAKVSCGTAGCALGLAHTVWPQFYSTTNRPEIFSIFDAESAALRHFSLNVSDCCKLFDEGMAREHGGYDHVQPHHVATAIRTFVSNRQAGEQT